MSYPDHASRKETQDARKRLERPFKIVRVKLCGANPRASPVPCTMPVGPQTQEPSKCLSPPFSSQQTGSLRCLQSGSGNPRELDQILCSASCSQYVFLAWHITATQQIPGGGGRQVDGQSTASTASMPSSLHLPRNLSKAWRGSFGNAVVSNTWPYFGCPVGGALLLLHRGGYSSRGRPESR